MSTAMPHITVGTKFTTVIAVILVWGNVPAGAMTASSILLLFDPEEPITSTGALLTMAVIFAAVCTGIAQMLIVVALGRYRSDGAPARLAHYQLAALGVGASLGIGFSPVYFDSPPWGWALALSSGLVCCGFSLLLFRGSRHRPLPHPPHSGIGLTEGTVIEHWSSRAGGLVPPALSVVRYTDEQGAIRFVRHMSQGAHAGLGALGQVHFDRRRPDHVLRFVPWSPAASIWNTRSSGNG